MNLAPDDSVEVVLVVRVAEGFAKGARIAAEEMVLLMQSRSDLDFNEAYMLMSAAVDVQICQCCEPGKFPTTARAVISKQILP